MNIKRYFPAPRVVKLFLFVGIVWAAVVGPLSFVLILTDKGASNAQIGIFSAIAAVVSMVFQPMWGMLGDKIGSPRKVLRICLAGSAIFFGTVLFTGNFYIAVVLLLLDTAFRCGVVGLLDSHTISEINKMPGLQYGHIRLAGSVFFGLLSLIYSSVIDNFSVSAIIPISVGVAIVAIAFGVFVAKDTGDKKETPSLQRPNIKKDAVSLFRNRRYLTLIIFVGLTALAVQPLWIFLIEFVTEVGGSAGNVPLIQALRCVVEVPLFIFVGSLCKRTNSKKLMILGTAFMMVYIIILLFANSFAWIVVAHLVGGTPGFIFGHTGRLRYLNEVAPETVRSTSITLMGTLEIGMGAILGNLIAGFVLDMYGSQVLTMASLGAIVVAMVVLLLLPNAPPAASASPAPCEAQTPAQQ